MCEVALWFGFYNIGWNQSDKSRGIRELQQEVLGLLVHHQVQVLGLCEVFDIDDNRNEEQQVARQLVEYLNCAASTSSAAQPVSGTCDALANRLRLQMLRGTKLSLQDLLAKVAKRPVPEV